MLGIVSGDRLDDSSSAQPAAFDSFIANIRWISSVASSINQLS
jgi:hypothetical protein